MTELPSTTAQEIQERRWIVHLWLIISFVASLLTLLIRMSIGAHCLLGLLFAVLVVVHLVQRKKRIRGLLHRLQNVTKWVSRSGRLAWSDIALTFLFINVTVSGIADYVVGGRGVLIPVGVVSPIRWHAVSAILLMLYITVHVARRATQLKSSRVS